MEYYGAVNGSHIQRHEENCTLRSPRYTVTRKNGRYKRMSGVCCHLFNKRSCENILKLAVSEPEKEKIKKKV